MSSKAVLAAVLGRQCRWCAVRDSEVRYGPHTSHAASVCAACERRRQKHGACGRCSRPSYAHGLCPDCDGGTSPPPVGRVLAVLVSASDDRERRVYLHCKYADPYMIRRWTRHQQLMAVLVADERTWLRYR